MSHRLVPVISNNFHVFRLHTEFVGRWWSEVTAVVLEKLLRKHRRTRVGRRLGWSNAIGRMPRRNERSAAWRATRWCNVVSFSKQARSSRCLVSARDQRREPNVIFMSKTIFLNASPPQQILELDKITTHHWSVVGVSAVTGDKLLNAVDWLIGDIAKRIFTLDWSQISCETGWNCTRLKSSSFYLR